MRARCDFDYSFYFTLLFLSCSSISMEPKSHSSANSSIDQVFVYWVIANAIIGQAHTAACLTAQVMCSRIVCLVFILLLVNLLAYC